MKEIYKFNIGFNDVETKLTLIRITDEKSSNSVIKQGSHCIYLRFKTSLEIYQNVGFML